jgi:hypothetical protein
LSFEYYSFNKKKNKNRRKIEIGRRYNQQKPINISKRNRGKQDRKNRRKKESNPPIRILLEKKRDLVIREKTKTIPYSLKKINTKIYDLNSVLKPEINSLSPSAKSNGARLTSERMEIIQKGRRKINKNILFSQDSLPIPRITQNKIREKIIS